MEERLRGTADRTDLVRTASTVFEQTPLAPIPASVRIFTTRWKLIALRRRIRRTLAFSGSDALRRPL